MVAKEAKGVATSSQVTNPMIQLSPLAKCINQLRFVCWLCPFRLGRITTCSPTGEQHSGTAYQKVHDMKRPLSRNKKKSAHTACRCKACYWGSSRRALHFSKKTSYAYSSARGGAISFARAWLWLSCRATGESALEVHFWMIVRYVALAGPLRRAFWGSVCALGLLLR